MTSALYRYGAVVLLALCCCLIWTPAHALVYGVPSGVCSDVSGYSSAAAACSAGASALVACNNAADPPGARALTSSTLTGNSCFAQWSCYTNNGTTFTQVCGSATLLVVETDPLVCTPPQVLNPAGDACVTPVTTDEQICNDAALLDSATFGNRDVQIPGNVGTGYACMPTPGLAAGKGCTVAFSRSASYQKADGTWLSEGTYTRPNGGGVCGIATPESLKPPAEPDTCKNGQPGQVNGVTVCVPFSGHTPTVTDKKTTETTTTPEGTEQKETTSHTTCKDGICTTSTTTNTTIGGTTTTTTNVTTNSKGDHCKGAAGSPECGTGSSFTGDCAAGFNYEGDAIQGAIAKEIHKQNCLMNIPTSESAAYEAAKLKTGDQTTDLPGNETKAITSADIDQTNAIVGGTCIADRTITINLVVTTTTVVLPFSSVCPLLEYFRWVLIALGFFIAYRIIGGR